MLLWRQLLKRRLYRDKESRISSTPSSGRPISGKARFQCDVRCSDVRLVFCGASSQDATMMKSVKRRYLFRLDCLVVGVVSLSLCVTLSAREVASVFLKGPYLQGPGTDTMTIK